MINIAPSFIQPRILLNIFIFALTLGAALKAHAVFITPHVVVIDDGQRAAQITINNRGKQPKIFRFEWERRAMSSDGKSRVLNADESVPGYRPADPYLKFSPRQVILQPGEHQKIRIMAQRPPDLAPGEYHSHLLIKEDRLAKVQDPENPTGSVAGQVMVNLYKSVPVFLRHGETSVAIVIDEATLLSRNSHDYVRMKISNNSSRSIYGEMSLVCRDGGKAAKASLTTLRLYTEVTTMEHESLVRDFPARNCGNLVLQLSGSYDFEYAGKVIDERPVSIE